MARGGAWQWGSSQATWGRKAPKPANLDGQAGHYEPTPAKLHAPQRPRQAAARRAPSGHLCGSGLKGADTPSCEPRRRGGHRPRGMQVAYVATSGARPHKGHTHCRRLREATTIRESNESNTDNASMLGNQDTRRADDRHVGDRSGLPWEERKAALGLCVRPDPEPPLYWA